MRITSDSIASTSGPTLHHSSSYSELAPDVVEQSRSTHGGRAPNILSPGSAELLKADIGTAGDTRASAPVLSNNRAFNFAPGPGMLFEDVMLQAHREFMNWQGTGISILEMSHRSPEFGSIIDATRDSLRTLANVPADYEILFVQGGATQIFSSLPMNLSKAGDTVDYIVNGYWSEFAAQEAGRYCNVNIAAIDETFTTCPDRATWQLTPGAAYVHYCANETIHGCEYQEVPDVGDVPLICDMSSNFLSKPLDVSKFDMIYAGAHKNVGPAGLAIIVVKKKLLGAARPETPLMLNFEALAEAGSMLNTPPVFPIYFAGLVFAKLLALGGLEAMEQYNRRKAALLYDALDQSGGYYTYPMRREVRSLMNVPFALATPALEAAFLAEAGEARLLGLKGHKVAGHCRASIYNGMPLEGVRALVAFLKDFQKRHPVDASADLEMRDE
uniref:Phosphoserine aminotransferase n=1 Tax=Pyramimonas obovata TaxID=1411642 RepID=A0A7S0QUC2_9CHLO|mmetsp:Transcript_21011/g.46072  ORF Transcript_21011/g.46072 Transcript_21011/m.46072 type:complete len:443 (+) Transcript_21011:233-1561(+)